MLPDSRRREIVEQVREHEGCSVTELADRLGFSKATIRRDLRDLDAEGAIERSHGGAVPTKAIEEEDFLGVTNSPHCALELARDDREAKLTGGTLRPRTQALVGPSAEAFMQRIFVDRAFLGTNAIDAERGLMTPNEDEARMKRLMIEHAEEVILVADASKLGERSFVEFADLADLDRFFTDATIGEESEYGAAFAESGVAVRSVGGTA